MPQQPVSGAITSQPARLQQIEIRRSLPIALSGGSGIEQILWMRHARRPTVLQDLAQTHHPSRQLLRARIVRAAAGATRRGTPRGSRARAPPPAGRHRAAARAPRARCRARASPGPACRSRSTAGRSTRASPAARPRSRRIRALLRCERGCGRKWLLNVSSNSTTRSAPRLGFELRAERLRRELWQFPFARDAGNPF